MAQIVMKLTISCASTFETAIHNNNLTVNNLHGPGVINNHNQITNYIAYTDLPKESVRLLDRLVLLSIDRPCYRIQYRKR